MLYANVAAEWFDKLQQMLGDARDAGGLLRALHRLETGSKQDTHRFVYSMGVPSHPIGSMHGPAMPALHVPLMARVQPLCLVRGFHRHGLKQSL